MKKRPRADVAKRSTRSKHTAIRYPAAEFKAKCLELMDRVRETGVEYVVTKHGRPVAKLVPWQEPEKAAFFGSMRGTLLEYDRPLDPIDAAYDINRD